jgi:trimethylamine-N-oxide reductase (cytochrome c)
MENDCLFADIILPVNTKFEEDDIGTDMVNCHFDTLFLERKCIESIGESKSDYEIVGMVAEKMGKLEEYTGGRSVEEWIKYGWEVSGVADMVSWEELNEKQYYVVPTDPNWESYPAGMINFYNDPEKHPLSTPTGKLEIYSQRLADHFPDDRERPPLPRWIEGGPCWTHDESLSSERAKKYPLLCQSNHGRWRVHAQFDDVDWFHEIETCKVRGPDGYLYEPVWIHPSEAGKRGIKNGDAVRIFNERGVVLCGAYVTERIRPGVVYVDHGARYDPVVPGELDRGGAINTITPHYGTSQNCRGGMVVSGFLVEAERANLDELRKQHPEAFKRPYDRASGLRFKRVLHDAGGKEIRSHI